MAEKKNVLAVLLGADRGKLRFTPTKQVEIKRLSDAAGEPVVFTLRALTSDEMDAAQEAATRTLPDGDTELDARTVQAMCVLHATKDPDLKSRELCDLYDAATPEELLLRSNFLLPGELLHLFNEVQELSGFGDDAVVAVKN